MKTMLKAMAAGVCRLLALPWWIQFVVARPILGRDRAVHGASQAVSLLPGVLGEYIRREFHRVVLEECSADCCLGFGVIFSKQGARVGRRVYVGTNCNLGLVTLGDDVLLASSVDVLSGSGQHRFDDPDVPVREQGGEFRRVTIGRDTWIGNRSVVMADVGERCVVGAGSVVTQRLEDGTVAVGSPARAVGRRGNTAEADG